MLRGRRGIVIGIAITLVFAISVLAVFASIGEQKISVLFNNIKIMLNGSEISLTDADGNEVEPFIYNGTTYIPIRAVSEAFGKDVNWDNHNNTVLINDPMPMLDLGFDTNYFPLPDINSEKVIEKSLSANQTELNGIIFDNTPGFQKVKTIAQDDGLPIIIDENGNYIIASNVGESGEQSDICITKYDSQGNEVKRKIYGGSDFDTVYESKFNSTMGIVIAGVSQSTDGDFANDHNSPFIACIDAETLALKWIYPVQGAGEPFEVTKDSLFVVNNEGGSYRGGDLKLSVVKLDKSGKKVWQTEPLTQWIHDIKHLSDDKIIVTQQYINEQGNGIDGIMTVYSNLGEKLTSIKGDCYGKVTPLNDNGFITVSVRNVKTVPQPVYLSSIWYDTETVVTKYNKDYNVEWRKTYDSVKDAVGLDKIIPQNDGSVIVVK